MKVTSIVIGCACALFAVAIFCAAPHHVGAVEQVPSPTGTPTPTAPVMTGPCCGDANGDGIVSSEELLACVPSAIPEQPLPAACDCNHDGVVSAGELTLILYNFTNRCPGVARLTATSTATETARTPTPTATPEIALCTGDCSGDGQVTVDEILTGVDIALGVAPMSACANGFGCCPEICIPEVDCLLRAVDNALNGCPPALSGASLFRR